LLKLKFRRGRKEKPLVLLVREEIEWYWWTRLGRLGRGYLLLSSLLAVVSSLVTMYILFQPLVYYDGFQLSGFIAPLRYSLSIAGEPARYPVLDSLSVISIFMYLFALITLSFGVLGVIGVFKKWRTWTAFTVASTSSASLLVSLLYSLLRVYSLNVIPSLPYTITVYSVGGGRIILNPPRTTYTWVYWLPWRPLYFFIAYTLLIAFTAGSLVLLVLNPKPPVVKSKPRRKKGGSSGA